MPKRSTPEYDEAMWSFARFLAAQIVREWREEQTACASSQDVAVPPNGIPALVTLWPAWLQPGKKVWWHFRQVIVDSLLENGGIVLRLVRRGGSARYEFTFAEVNQMLAHDQLREYVRTRRDL